MYGFIKKLSFGWDQKNIADMPSKTPPISIPSMSFSKYQGILKVVFLACSVSSPGRLALNNIYR
jgi:hypothetical protein